MPFEPAYAVQAHITHKLSIDGEMPQEYSFEPHDQLAAVFVYFSDCILNDLQPAPSGQEGLIDVQIICALSESIQTGKFISLENIKSPPHRPNPDLTIALPPLTQQPELIRVADPAGKS
ncbi:hypothetical protein [Chamaesiphon sp. GL140_3_metabinner_50]|uniref:hypothetical protein n=1 Tax=Chamaesiphon sp. GL140_3_metabinner_50 TaxID=2970812 RepID=UPI0025EAFF4E|nr:hypothetical protein [Chamaesiphon sp. GL140_3_metabinner_50]